MFIIGHRGAAAYAPENTFISFDLAEKLGCDAIETDIRETKDGNLVLLHDETVDRTTNGKGKINELTLNEVKALDAGSWFSTEFSGKKIPTLKEFLTSYGNKIKITLEIKDSNIEEKVVSVIEEQEVKKENIIITSFSLDYLLNIKELSDEFTFGYLVEDLSSKYIQKCVKNDFEHICPPASKISEKEILNAQSNDLFVRAFGVNNEKLMKKVVDIGVDGMTIDFPDKLMKYLKDS